ncbi:MAG: H-type lectin domain-containing protein, partial [Alphaproteobacteria bacterium]|nr:H-type lectin domain-containing protein [Alphaproteobacteria bacterium]
ISMWDMDQKSNQRADISAEEITTEGFTIVFRTWGDTRVARVRADWTAIGPLPDEDDWEVY